VKEIEYQSSAMTCEPGCSGCLICDFLGGKEDTQILKHIIRYLDHQLYIQERMRANLLGKITDDHLDS